MIYALHINKGANTLFKCLIVFCFFCEQKLFNAGFTNKMEQVADAYQSARQPKANYQIPASALYEPTGSVAPGRKSPHLLYLEQSI